MHITRPATLFTTVLLLLFIIPAQADENEGEKDDGLTKVVASQDLSVRRGTDKAVKEGGIHPKNVSSREKHKLDRISLIRFDSEDFGKGVRVAGLKLEPVNFSDHNKAMRFRVYGVNDKDEQDEKFAEKTYDPNAEDTIIDRRNANLLNRRQVSILGTFSTEQDESVQFTSDLLLSFLRADTNGTVTLVLVRESESGHNSTFAPRQSETPPTVVMKLFEKKDQADQEPAEQAEPAEQEAEPGEAAQAQ